MNFGAYFGNCLWQLASYPEHRRFVNGRRRLQEEQEKVLGATLSALKKTLYGERYQIEAAWTYEQFRENLPLSTYQDQLPYFQVKGGILTEDVRVWEPTGGSSGGSKWIPWTAGLQGQFRRAVSAWIFDFFSRRPELRRGRSYWQLTPKAEMSPPSWLQEARTGFQSDGEYLGPLGRYLERLITLQTRGDDEFWERTLRSLRGAKDLRLISCWSPTFLLLLKERALDLFGTWQPLDWWPRLVCLSCWTHGPSQLYEPEVRRLFPGVALEGKGLLSTEAVTTVPFQGRYPLAYRSHFFEFQADDGRVYPSWQLERGALYKVLQTTAAGLVRYDSGDLVRLESFWGRIPCLTFLSREGVSDRFGEKLSHAYLNENLTALGRFAALGFEDGAYVLFLEMGESEEEARACYRRMDALLNEVYTYRDCVEMGQLRPLRCYLLKGGALVLLGKEVGDEFALRKASVILPEGQWSARLSGRFLPAAADST